jgi:predicted nucleic acid-binding Zn ribbon protein
MTPQLNQTQIVVAIPEKNKMPVDHDSSSASTQCSSHGPALSDDLSQSSSPQRALRQCIYIALRCSRCGSVRQAITHIPEQPLIACPECGRECSFVMLGSGFTSRDLPFHQVHGIEPTRWDQQVDCETNSS